MSDYLKKRLEHINAGRPDYADKTQRDRWFARVETKEFKRGFSKCWECGEIIPISLARHATAHILAKADFESVATHPLNYLILGAGCCHNKTHRFDTFIAMKVWPIAAQRLKVLLPLLTPQEHGRLPDYLLDAVQDF